MKLTHNIFPFSEATIQRFKIAGNFPSFVCHQLADSTMPVAMDWRTSPLQLVAKIFESRQVSKSYAELSIYQGYQMNAGHCCGAGTFWPENRTVLYVCVHCLGSCRALGEETKLPVRIPPCQPQQVRNH